MTRIIKIISFFVLAIFIAPLLIALFVSKEFNYEKSIVIDAPITEVWKKVNSFSAMDSWDPLNEYDANLTKSITGVDGKVGTEESWESEIEDIGKGRKIIKKIDAPSFMHLKVDYISPLSNKADVFVKLDDLDGKKTKVVWGFESQIPYPLNISRLFSDVYELSEKDYTSGLNKLKRLSEN